MPKAKDILFVGVQGALFVAYLFRITELDVQIPEWLQWAGAAFGILGVFTILLAIYNLKSNLSPFPTPLESAELVQHGVYALVRHPIYTGIIVGGFGYGLFTQNGLRVLIALALLIWFRAKAKYEEQLLLKKYKGYGGYMQHTGMLFPKLTGGRTVNVLLFLLLFSTTGCTQQKVESGAYGAMLEGLLSHSVPETSVDLLLPDSGIVYLDAREYREYEVSHIDGAVWVGYKDFDLKRVATVEKDKKVVVYCSVGYRSEKIAEKLIKAGYTNVYNLYGGIFEWKNQGADVVNDDGGTQEVHAFNKKWGYWLDEGEKVYE